VAALRTALEWRDEIARRWDKATFRVVGDGPLIDAVAASPLHVRDLAAIKGFPGRLANEEGAALLDRLDRIAMAPDSELRPYPKGPRQGPGRPSPEVEALAERLKTVRNRRADELGLPRGTLLANGVVLEIARAAPRSMQELEAIEGMRKWKAAAVGEEMLALIRAARGA